MMRADRLGCLGLALFAVLAPATVRGQDVTARAYLSTAEVGLNRRFVLSIEVSGARKLDEDPELPDMSAFSTHLGSGTSTSMQIINFHTSTTYTVQHEFLATKEGTFEIGAVTVRAADRTLKTDPLKITVTSSPRASRGPPPPGGDDDDIGEDDLFVTADVSRRRVYENEPVVVEYRIWTAVNIAGVRVSRLPEATGFWVEQLSDTGRPAVEERVRNGIRYRTLVPRRVALFPTGPGTKVVEPLTIEAQVELRSRARDPFSSFFDAPFFGRRVPVAVASKPVEIEVVPLPEGGRPAKFSGFVGTLDVSASVDSTRIVTNDAITYRVRVSGSGNLRSLPDPDIRFAPEFEAFPPEEKERIVRSEKGISGTKTYEYVLIPRAPGTLTVPAVRYAYFDPTRKTYRTAEAPAIAIEVTGAPVAAAGAAGRPRGSVDQLRRDIRFIRIATPRFDSPRGPLVGRAEFWVVVLLPLLAVGTALGYRRQRDRLEGDVAYARLRRARRVAARRLGRARSLVSPDSQREFYAEVGRALRGFLGDKLNIAEAGMIADELRPALLARGGAADDVAEYLGCLQICDRQRFAPSSATEVEMRTFLDRAENAMARLDRAVG